MATRSENVRRFGVTADHARGVAGSLRRRRRLFPGCTALSVALSQQRRAPPDSISQSRRCRTSRRCGYPLLNFSPSRLNFSPSRLNLSCVAAAVAATAAALASALAWWASACAATLSASASAPTCFRLCLVAAFFAVAFARSCDGLVPRE